MRGINGDAIDRTHLDALWRLKVSDTLGAARRIDLVNTIAHKYCIVGAFGLTHVAVDTFIGDDERHGYTELLGASLAMQFFIDGLQHRRRHKL
mgnify:CR=1 FL=1